MLLGGLAEVRESLAPVCCSANWVAQRIPVWGCSQGAPYPENGIISHGWLWSQSKGLTAWFRFELDSVAIGFAGRHFGFGFLFAQEHLWFALLLLLLNFFSLCFFISSSVCQRLRFMLLLWLLWKIRDTQLNIRRWHLCTKNFLLDISHHLHWRVVLGRTLRAIKPVKQVSNPGLPGNARSSQRFVRHFPAVSECS